MAIETQNVNIDGQPIGVNGTVTSNQGTPAATGNKWPIEIVDSAGTNVATVNASGELLTTDTDLTLSQGSTTSGQLGPLVQGAVTTAAPSYTTAQTSPLSLDTSGNLRTVAAQPTSNTSSVTQVVLVANTNATLLSANASRKKFIVFVPKSTTYIKYGVTASATSFTWASLTNNATVDDTIWTGQIDIFSTQAQTVTVTELT